jgi:hypothetical protein
LRRDARRFGGEPRRSWNLEAVSAQREFHVNATLIQSPPPFVASGEHHLLVDELIPDRAMKPKVGVGGVKQIGIVAQGESVVADTHEQQPISEFTGLKDAVGE